MQGDAGKPGKSGEPEGSGKPEEKGPKGAARPGKEASAKSGGAKDPSRAEGNRRALRVGIVVLALLVGVIAWVATRGDDDESTPTTAGTEARIVDLGELEEFAADSGHAVYWAGVQPGKEIEVSESSAGNVEVRYLDEGTEAGGGGAAVLTIGSYPLADPKGAVEGFAKRKGSLVRHAPDGREVVTSVEKLTSVYFAGSEGDVQVEVYDPSYKRAMSLALSDRVQPVG
jgi:hypothetical protein